MKLPLMLLFMNGLGGCLELLLGEGCCAYPHGCVGQDISMWHELMGSARYVGIAISRCGMWQGKADAQQLHGLDLRAQFSGCDRKQCIAAES